jgi:hypothetical protein
VRIFIWGLRGIFATGLLNRDVSGRQREITCAISHLEEQSHPKANSELGRFICVSSVSMALAYEFAIARGQSDRQLPATSFPNCP